MKNFYLIAILIILCVKGELFAQTDSLRRELLVDFEVRPRAEYRDNFMWTAADTVMPKLYVTQRNRLSIS